MFISILNEKIDVPLKVQIVSNSLSVEITKTEFMTQRFASGQHHKIQNMYNHMQ